ncbi:shematrin-like protein 1 [Daphnia pulicaria]|uniref:shematrin-like protein 1 n=1 Tax=Daphnia pulicaria TaxID=35523 RepID=UPI001EEC690D|nr:shematrin-like protein 1 [Daphnia pulicaria]
MKLFVPTVLLLLVSMSLLAVISAAAGDLAQQHIDDPSTALDMEPSESKVKIYNGFGYGYGGYALPLARRYYPFAGATVLVGYPLLTGYGGYYGYGGYGGYGGVIPYPLGYSYGR